MRLATIMTPRGLRLQVAGTSGYLDVADETGEPGYASLAGLLAAGPAGFESVRNVGERPGTEFIRSGFRASGARAPADPVPRRELLRARDRRRPGRAHLAGGVRARRRQRDRAVRRPGQAGPDQQVRLRGRARRSSSARAAATSRRTRRWTRSRVTSCSTTPRRATGSGPRRNGPPARTSRAPCRSGPNW